MQCEMRDLDWNTVHFELENTVSGISVRFDQEALHWFCSDAENPYYQLRGCPVTPEQAMDIFGFTAKESHRDPFLNFDVNPFGENSWLYPSGYIGQDGNVNKYETIYEYVYEWVKYVKQFPYLDLVVGLTEWNCMPPAVQDLMSDFDEDPELYEKVARRKILSFPKSVEIGFWIHDGGIEVLSPEAFAPKYKEYNAKYPYPWNGSPFRIPRFWNDKLPSEVTPDYIRQMLEKSGVELTDEDFEWEYVRPFEHKQPCGMAEFFKDNNA